LDVWYPDYTVGWEKGVCINEVRRSVVLHLTMIRRYGCDWYTVTHCHRNHSSISLVDWIG
jgi:hypothetical protein